MKKIIFNGQRRNKHFLIVLYHSLLVKGAMNAARLCNCAMVLKKRLNFFYFQWKKVNQVRSEYLRSYSGRTKYRARAQSIACLHSTYVITPKKHKFRTKFFGKIKKEEFASRFFKKNSVFSRLKLLNKHISKMTYFFYQCFVSSLLWRGRNFAHSKT